MSVSQPSPGHRSELDRAIERVPLADTLSPADRYEELFVDVQMSRVFEDSKTFVDCVPVAQPSEILESYRERRSARGFDLNEFVRQHFSSYQIPPNAFEADPECALEDHIERLWPVLTRHPPEHPARSSLLPLPYDYLVPGGRFTEIYYWDSYFIMLGLHESNCSRCHHLLRCMADNFAYLIDTHGHVPNGNRTYYLGRSQPPLFCFMVALFEETGVRRAVDYLPQLRREYDWWMEGARGLAPGEAHRRCVRLPDGTVMNRYWDDRDAPREESWAEDVLTARRAKRPVHDVYRDLRAGAESGWDFSSRWQDDPRDICTIRTTGIVPVDLNCFLVKLEWEISRLSRIKGAETEARDFDQRADRRCAGIDRWLWNESEGAYFDYDWQRNRQRNNLTGATAAPLFVGCASDRQARFVAEVMAKRLLAPGGVSTTEISGSGQQWDQPNGWAPLQWMAVQGLLAYDHNELAYQVSHRWLTIVSELYKKEAKLVEKYILRPTTEHATGGEYPLQDGFGWTNGVVARLLRDNPEDAIRRCRAGRNH